MSIVVSRLQFTLNSRSSLTVRFSHSRPISWKVRKKSGGNYSYGKRPTTPKMESILESQRKLHEERERIVDAIMTETMCDKKSHKAHINSQTRVANMADRYFQATKRLEKTYVDERGERERELEQIAGPNEFAEFYSRLKSLKDQHKRNPDEPAHCLSIEFQKINSEANDPEREEPDMVTFTDEEGYGRYLDLHICHDKYLNLKGIKRVDYISYLGLFDKFHEINRNVTKKTGTYKEYLQTLKDYFVSFIQRTRPVLDVLDEMDKADADVERLWDQGGVPGWSQQKGSMAGQAAVPLDLSAVNAQEELESLGLERLKSALQALGLKCGGTLKERAGRLYATKNHKLSDLEKAALSKTDAEKEKENMRNKHLAKLEMQIKTLAGMLMEEREATRENVERKQARAVGEGSDEEEEVELDSDPEEDDSVPYNPKNLPLGWDGKPIPYWLYKLHGLNISYQCEICGNQTYKGPKAFQRHFTEWRHSHSMRCLGIPNTAHFANITKIAEALALWNKIKKEKESLKWNPEHDEEFEDSAGNVVNRRTFEDLKRQGLL